MKNKLPTIFLILSIALFYSCNFSNKDFILNKHTVVVAPNELTAPVENVINLFNRDMQTVFGQLKPNEKGGTILLEYASEEETFFGEPERFSIKVEPKQIVITGSDDLALVYGLLHISQHSLGVDPFWFWADCEPLPKKKAVVAAGLTISQPFAVRYRGWFINDETCFFGWKNQFPPPNEVWQPAFEALLRLGGNMVIPGTDLPRDGEYWTLAAQMGLYFTHHHVEPLGAEMFTRRFPDKVPSFKENRPLYEQLWEEAIERQKDNNVVWVLGFRGQGDRPFWENDPRYQTSEARGAVISEVIAAQHSLLKSHLPDAPCAAYIYGELAQLYQEGHITLPKGTIKIWSDNGYGKMVSRRMWLDNPRVHALPTKQQEGPHGIYYHLSFHDLQASNYLTMMIDPELIISELNEVVEKEADTYWIINSGVIRPHLLTLDLVASLWRGENPSVKEQIDNYVNRLYSSNQEAISQAYQTYFDSTISTGKHLDEKAGEQFYHYPVRQLAGAWIRDHRNISCREVQWATGEIDYNAQIAWFKTHYAKAIASWTKEMALINDIKENASLSERDQQFLFDNLELSTQIHLNGALGGYYFCKAYQAFDKGETLEAYALLSQSILYYQKGVEASKQSEHGKWAHFYETDWTTNMRTTVYALETTVRYVRAIGDDTRFNCWSNKYVMKIVGDQKIKSKFFNDKDLGNEIIKLFPDSFDK